MIFKRFVAIALVLGFISGSTAATPKRASQAQPAGLILTDLTDDFDRIWNSTAETPDDKRATAFEAAFAKVLPGFYDPKRVAEYMSEAKYQSRFLEKLKAYPENRVGIQRVSHEFASLIGPAQRSFEKAFGPMRGYPPIYLVNSLGEFDGGTRDLPEGNRLMFGADVIDKMHKEKPIQPFFHHELFHLYHHRTFKGCEQIWCNLWSEGLAVYVASRLNPKADDGALLLNVPVPLRAAVESHKAEAICAVRSRLGSSDPKDYGPLFTGGGDGLSANLPNRFAYYVGYLVAQDIGRSRSLKQLAALRNDQLRPLLEQSLDRMAKCPAPSA